MRKSLILYIPIFRSKNFVFFLCFDREFCYFKDQEYMVQIPKRKKRKVQPIFLVQDFKIRLFWFSLRVFLTMLATFVWVFTKNLCIKNAKLLSYNCLKGDGALQFFSEKFNDPGIVVLVRL